MPDAIAAVNAGSSSVKFSLFAAADGELELKTRGQIEGILTAGIGENSRSLRERVCRNAAWLGLELDTTANQGHGSRISTSASRVAAWVIPTNEEEMIARHTQTLLSRTLCDVK